MQRVDPDTIRWKTPTILSHIRINHKISDKTTKNIVLGHVRRSYEFIESREE